MSKVKYYYDSETLSYRKIERKKGRRLGIFALSLLGMVLSGFMLLLIYINLPYIETPKEKALKRELSNMNLQFSLLNMKMNQATAVLEEVADRDNNLYRVYFEVNPIPEEQRYAGFGGVNRYRDLEGFDNSNLIISSSRRLDILTKQIVVQSRSLDEIAILAEEKEKLLAAIPAIQPVKNEDLTRMASGFGYRTDPFTKARKRHWGMDFTAPRGTPVYATGDGKVKRADNTASGYGRHIRIDHGYGYESLYAHLYKYNVRSGRRVKRDKQDNFWEMGDQGPCGPCSEIHVDLRSSEEKEKQSGVELINKDHPQVVEIWNLVFMQFNRKANGSLEKLSAQHVDTGMGFERLCMVLQQKQSNYDTDVFTPLIREIEVVTNSSYGKDEKTDIAIRVISDHVRAVAFSIADGQLPSNTGAGYVIRRILRRAIRYGFTFLDIKNPFIHKLVDTLSKQMGDAFPELVSEKNLITNVIREEEHSFLRTLDQGLILLENVIEGADSKTISGKKAFELYDTFGFPIDLTALILRERGYDLDEEGFDKELQKQKERSRAATKVETGDWEIINEDTEEEFIGYDILESNIKITRYRKVESKKEGELYQLVFNLTPFYPEGGGQVGDKGYLEAPDGEVVYIIDTKKENNLIIHFVKNLPRKPEETFKAVVDKKQRSRTASNHTATHLLHQALRNILGEHVGQKGSMVHSKNLRFDFSHFSKVTDDELRQVEDFVNARIHEGILLDERRNIPYQQAIDEGAIALFGEKYGDAVRAIKFGKSMELCGGTHVESTLDIWHFIITSESAIASGVRRIEAITGDAAKQYFIDRSESFKEIQKALQNLPDPLKAVIGLQDENSRLQKQLRKFQKDKAKNIKGDLKNEVSQINGINFLTKELDLDASGLKDLAFELGNEIDKLFILFGSNHNGKALLTCYISKELVAEKSLDAGQVVRELGKYIQGGGGGQPFFATAGGKDPQGISTALEKAKIIYRKLETSNENTC